MVIAIVSRNARLLHSDQGGKIGREGKMVNGHSSYHLEPAWKEDGEAGFLPSILRLGR